MKYHNLKRIVAIMTTAFLLIGCGRNTHDSAVVIEPSQELLEEDAQEWSDESLEGFTQEEQQDQDVGEGALADGTEQFDYEALGVVGYSYPENFVLDGDLLDAVQVIATEDKFDEAFIHDDKWKKDFLNLFVFSMYDGPEYERKINADGKTMTREQVEYIQCSLTGEYISYEELSNEIDATDSTYSPMISYTINDYEYEYDGEDVIVNAEAGMYRKGDPGTYKYNLKIRLKPDKFSCFCGYNIVSLEKEEIKQVQVDDGNKHEIIWYCSGEDVLDNVITGEFFDSEDTLFYNMNISLVVTDEQKAYILDNVPANFVITYDFEEAGMSYPITEITPKTISVKEKF